MRVIRVLVYEGEESWIRGTLQMRAVKGGLTVAPNQVITEYYLIESSRLGVLQNGLMFTQGEEHTDDAH